MRKCLDMHGRLQMLGEDYTLEYLPLFDEELSEAVRYISVELKNPDAAARLVDDMTPDGAPPSFFLRVRVK